MMKSATTTPTTRYISCKEGLTLICLLKEEGFVMLCRKATLLFLCVFMTYSCASFHCTKEVQWLLEDARLHEMQHTSRDAMLAERFHTIADYLDSGKVER